MKLSMINRVKCLETAIVYDSVKEAAKATLTTPSSIYSALKGRTITAGGYHWRYKHEDRNNLNYLILDQLNQENIKIKYFLKSTLVYSNIYFDTDYDLSIEFWKNRSYQAMLIRYYMLQTLINRFGFNCNEYQRISKVMNKDRGAIRYMVNELESKVCFQRDYKNYYNTMEMDHNWDCKFYAY